MKLPDSHLLRHELHDEVHARPPLPLSAPARLSCLALVSSAADRDLEWQMLRTLAAGYGHELAVSPASHITLTLGACKLKWERHTEYSRYVVAIDGGCDPPFSKPAIEVLPKEWVEKLPGKVIFAGHVAVLAADAASSGASESADLSQLSRASFDDRPLVGSLIAGGSGTALTDFRIGADGFSRIVLIVRDMTAPQIGRAVQALLEIDTYRMLALLAFPVARDLSPLLAQDERELSEIANLLVNADESIEPVLLDRLTTLQAQIERYEADHQYRFGAAAAYYAIVERRIAQLREERLGSLQMMQEFMERRLAPAMNTCTAAMSRLESLSQRVARATQLLSTRVGITRERQNQQLLESMNQRAAAQLRLQSTVEGLSVAAVTYYIVGLVNYLAKGLADAGVGIDPGIATAVSIPLVALLIAFGIRKIRRAVERQAEAS